MFSIQRYVIKVCQLLAAGQWFSLRTLVSPTNKIDRHDITEILLKLSLNIVRFELTTLVVICIDCIGSCRSNYHMNTTIKFKKAVNYQMPSFFLCPKGDRWIQFWLYCQTCMKRSSLGQRKSGLIRQVTSYKRFNSYEIFNDRTRKRCPFNTGDCLIEVDACACLTIHYITDPLTLCV